MHVSIAAPAIDSIGRTDGASVVTIAGGIHVDNTGSLIILGYVCQAAVWWDD